MIRKALVVGINEYPTCPLSGCVNDAEEIANLLKTNGDDSPNFDVKLMPNVAKRDELLGMLESLFCKGDSDIALFYFSGHGSDELTGRIITPDYNGKGSGVSMADILEIVHKSNCKNKVIILDCCFSGKFGELSSTMNHEATLGDGVTIMMLKMV